MLQVTQKWILPFEFSSGGKHGCTAPALHKQGQSCLAPCDPAETPGMKTVQQALRFPASIISCKPPADHSILASYAYINL